MKKISFGFSIIILLVSSISLSAQNLSPQPENLRKYICSILNFQSRGSRLEPVSIGSGFAYLDRFGNNYIITNRHVVEGGRSFSILVENYNALNTFSQYDNLEILQVDEINDIAILYFPAGQKPFSEGLSFHRASLREGDTVVSAGFPGLGGRPIWQLGRGNISNIEVIISGKRYIQHTATIDGGNSGGPLLVESGASPAGYSIIGINTSSGVNRNNTFFAVSINLIESMIDRFIPPRDNIESNIQYDHKGLWYNARFLKLNSITQGYISRVLLIGSEIDYYKIIVPITGGRIRISIEDENNAQMINLAAYDINRQKMAEGVGLINIEFEASEQGIAVYINVSAVGFAYGDYSLNVEFTPPIIRRGF